jgi:hypothetical protein
MRRESERNKRRYVHAQGMLMFNKEVKNGIMAENSSYIDCLKGIRPKGMC